MTGIHSGECACGSVQIEAAGDPVAELHCQCRQCQLRSGTGHSSYMVFVGSDAVKVEGETTIWSVTADTGNEKEQAFCPTCGTPTHVTFPANPGVTAVNPVLMRRPEQFAPGIVTYASRALAWDVLDPALTRFDEMPT